MGIWHDPDLGRPIAAPLDQCAELLGVDLATVREAATNVEPYQYSVRSDPTGLLVLKARHSPIADLREQEWLVRQGGSAGFLFPQVRAI